MIESKKMWRLVAVPFVLLPCFAAGQDAGDPLSARKPGTQVRVELIGDSTQTDSAGYGRGFCANFTAKVDCINLAKGGASTKTFRKDGLWDKGLASKPDYMLIQFGHNDEVSGKETVLTDRQVPLDQYQENLRVFVKESRAQGITPILVTPLTRRYFGPDGKIHSDLTAYSNGMKAVAEELKVPLINLQDESIAYLDGIGPSSQETLGLTKKDKDGKLGPDKTHLNWQGSYVFGRIVAVDLGKTIPSLAQYVQPQPATLPAEGVLAMKVIQKAPFKIVLVGDSTVATRSGWGPGFCATLTSNATCVDMGRNGASSTSYLADGWKQALAQKGQYYFIQFGNKDGGHGEDVAEYTKNLERMIRETHEAGAIPIVLSPLSPRTYREGKLVVDEDMRPYADAARKVANAEKLTYVDLFGMSRQFLASITPKQADAYNVGAKVDAKGNVTGGEGSDHLHLNDTGQKLFGRLIADNVIRTQVELGPDVIGIPEGSIPGAPKQAAPTDGK